MIQRQISQMVTTKTSPEQSKQYGQNNPQQPHSKNGYGYRTGFYLKKILKAVLKNLFQFFLHVPISNFF